MRTVDTDVVIILLGKFSLLHKINSDAAIWVALGTGRNFKYLQINTVSRSLGEEKSLAMPYFHSFILVVTRHQVSLERERKQLGKHGRATLM